AITTRRRNRKTVPSPWLPAAKIDLVADQPDRHRAEARRPGLCFSRIIDPQHQIGVGCPGPRAADALLFDRVGRITNSGGIEQGDRVAIEVELYLDDIAR